MIVKILAPAASFAGISYNTRKIDRNKGELMKVANFGPLQAFGHLKPRDYVNYLSALSALNNNVKLPQFHAIISAKGKTYSKESLTKIAENWLKEMGYGQQPYLIVFHKDTANNHVHLVTTRVNREGKKINSAYEHVRAQKAIREVLGYNLALQYKISTRAQYFMILESKGYPGLDPDENKIKAQITAFVPDKNRANAIGNLLRQYKNHPEIVSLMNDRFAIELVFHAAAGKKAYGYSIIDHDTKQVFKGSEVMPLKELNNETGHFTRSQNSNGQEISDVEPSLYIQPVSIADDVDDQQIHGMRRKRQRKARTNTR